MKVESRERDGVTVVKMEGMIKLGESARSFSEYLQKLLDDGTSSVLVDMSEIDYVDSTGLGELVGYLQRFSAEGRRLALLRPHTRILNLLKLTKLDEVFPIFAEESEGIAALSE